MTLPQEVSPVPDSESIEPAEFHPTAPGNLICDARLIFDTERVQAQVEDAARSAADNAALRSETVSILRAAVLQYSVHTVFLRKAKR